MGTRRTRCGAGAGVTWLALLLPAWAACSGCAESTLDGREADAETSADAATDAGPAAGTVSITLPPPGTRSLTVRSDGEPEWGPLQPLEDVDVCIVQRRPAFTEFMAFEKVEPPICTRSVKDALVVTLPKAPRGSDLIITYASPGLTPFVLTSRTDDVDLPLPIGADGVTLLLYPAGAMDPWLDPSPAGGDHANLIVIVTGPLDEGPVPENGYVPFPLLTGLGLTIAPEGESPFETATLPRLRFLSVPVGSAHIRLDSGTPHRRCRTNDDLAGFRLAGPVDVDLEFPLLVGHDHIFAAYCDPPDAADADAGSP